jgi:Cu/Ag efflux protein CusF
LACQQGLYAQWSSSRLYTDWPRITFGEHINKRKKGAFKMKVSKLIVASIMTVFCVAMLAGAAFSEEIKAKIKSIDPATNTVVVTDNNTDIPLVVEDKTAAEQVRTGKIKVGNKVKIKYEKKDGKNVATSLKKLPGC